MEVADGMPTGIRRLDSAGVAITRSLGRGMSKACWPVCTVTAVDQDDCSSEAVTVIVPYDLCCACGVSDVDADGLCDDEDNCTGKTAPNTPIRGTPRVRWTEFRRRGLWERADSASAACLGAFAACSICAALKRLILKGGMLPVLKGIDLRIGRGEMVAIMGSSGSGKSTLLNVLGLLDGFDQGAYDLDGVDMSGLSEKQARYRSQFLGFVFESFNLIAFKTALENVACRCSTKRSRVMTSTARPGDAGERLGDRSDHLPSSFPEVKSSAWPSPAP